jgi:hypothetical protein
MRLLTGWLARRREEEEGKGEGSKRGRLGSSWALERGTRRYMYIVLFLILKNGEAPRRQTTELARSPV